MKGIGLIAGVIILALILGGTYYIGTTTGIIPTLQIQPGTGQVGPTATDACPDTGLTALKLQNFNMLNTSGAIAEAFDMVMVCSGSDGIVTTITDTTSPTATNVNCGVDYTCKGVSSINANGDHGKIIAVKRGPADAKIVDGTLKFRASLPALNIDLDGTQHGRDEARMYDTDAAGWVYADNQTTANTWISPANECGYSNGTAAFGGGCTFGSTTANSTSSGAIAVGSGGKLNLRLDIRAYNTQDVQLEDFGWYLFVDAPSSTWDTPYIEVDGVVKTSNCAQLNEDEAKKFSGQEFCYKVTGVPVTNNNEVSIDMVYNALSGVNPTTQHINVTIVGIGAYRSTNDESVVKIGAVKDDTNQTVVLNEEEWQITIS